MCFVLYAGTDHEIPRKARDREHPGLCVESLRDWDIAIRRHFGKENVQYVGSTRGCGCDFPHAVFDNGQWLVYHDELDPEYDAKVCYNRQALVALLQSTGEAVVELYGAWEPDLVAEPRVRESISIADILDPSFHFREQGFYQVIIPDANNALHTDGESAALHPRR